MNGPEETTTEKQTPDLMPPGPREKERGRRVNNFVIRFCQLFLLGGGVWWAFALSHCDLQFMQIPGFLIALSISWWLVPEVRSRAVKLNLVDKPGEDRRIHKVAVPRLGGVAIYISVVATIVSLIAIAGRLPVDARASEGIIAIAVGGTLVFILGLIDDLESIKAKYKLITQVLAGCAAYSLGVRVKQIPIPQNWDIDLGFLHLVGGHPIELGWFSLPLTVLWLVGVANAVNLIDGMDGLAAGVSAISALTIWSVALGVSKPYAALMAAVVAGALLGFLRWNFNPARIFLGDSGAYLTGFILAAISVTGVIKGEGAASTIVVPTSLLVIFILFFPLLDTSWAVVRRLAKGKSIFSPDRQHIHHRLLDAGLDQKKVAYVIYFFSALLGLAAASFVKQQEYFLKLIAGVLVMALFFAEVLNRHRQKAGKQVLPSKDNEPPVETK